MKKISKSFMLIAAAAMAFSSCQEQLIPATPATSEGINVIVTSDGTVDYVNTKTAVVEGANGTYVKWLSTDKIDVFEGVDGTFNKYTSDQTTLSAVGGEDDVKAEFGVPFGETREGSSFVYTAVYPSGSIDTGGSGSFYRFSIPATQNLVDGNLAADSDILIGVPISRDTRVTDGEKLSYSFYRPGTIVRLRLKGINTGETIKKVVVSAPDGVKFVGYSKIDLTTGKAYDQGYSYTSNAVTLNVDNLSSDGDDYVYFRTLACEWAASSKISISVETDKAYYNKEDITLPKAYSFVEGGFTAFGFDLSGSREEFSSDSYELVTDVSTLKVGDIVRFGCASQNKAAGALGSNPPTSYLSAADATIADGVLTSQTALDFTLGGESGAWIFTSENGALYADSNLNLYLTAQEGAKNTWNISIGDDASATISSTEENYGTLKYNSTNPRFKTYTSSQKGIELYKHYDAPREKQTLTFLKSSYEATKGEDFAAPTVSGASTDVTYSSSNPDAATVDATSGAVTLIGAGSTIITAKAVETDAYRGARAFYTLTVKLPTLTTMDDIFAAATSVGATPFDVTVNFNNWVVSAVKNKNAYVTDNAGKGLVIYTDGHGFVVGDKLSGTVPCKVQLYYGMSELTTLTSTSEGLTVTKGGSVTPKTISIAELSGVNAGAILTFSKLKYDGSAFSDGINKITPYNTFINLPALLPGREYNVKGVYIQFNSTKEIAPLETSDIELISATEHNVTLGTVSNGTISSDVTTAAEGQIVSLTATPASGYELEAWDVKDASSNLITVTDNKFTMPASAVTVSATFKAQSGPAKPKQVTISYSDIPDGYTKDTGTSGTFTKTVISADDLTIGYTGINTKSKEDADDHSYKYIMFLKNYGVIYSNKAIDGYYVSKVTVTFTSNTSTSGKVGIKFGSTALSGRDTAITTGSATKGGTYEASNTTSTNTFWNFSTNDANVQVSNIVVEYTKK